MTDRQIEFREEYLRDAQHEYNMRNDFDYFTQYISDKTEELKDLVAEIHSEYHDNGWEFDIDEVLE